MNARIFGAAAVLTVVLTTAPARAAPPASNPVADGNAGLDALKAGDYAKAEAMFTRALGSSKLAGDDREFAYSQRGEAYLKDGKYAQAIADFQRALKINADDSDAQAGLEEAQSHGDGGGKPSRAEAAPRRESPSENPVQLAQTAMDALNAGDFTRAAQLFTRAIDSGRLSDDDKELALVSRGKANLGKGDSREAAGDFSKALRLKSDDDEAQASLIKALTQVKAQTPTAGIDNQTCARNFTTVGSVLLGKTYTSYAEYPTVTPLDAFAGVYTALLIYTPMPTLPWQMSQVNLETGYIKGQMTFDSARAVSLEVTVKPQGGGSKITITETVPPLLPTLDLKGQMCRALADTAKG